MACYRYYFWNASDTELFEASKHSLAALVAVHNGHAAVGEDQIIVAVTPPGIFVDIFFQ
eukprot:CAMPEP_0170511804 /NCGR_PEP_ID=MMETSP0208-20121228/66501_1 /TAXON_ID=197538 /ORGANISM="Strombidium inclinatum, Strain S3" /LENGTH=58 /DNA_ID=CAMNT_0010795371 /DNA_START=105 /DNA_END=281 /DNA_ORIENTATION=-